MEFFVLRVFAGARSYPGTILEVDVVPAHFPKDLSRALARQ